MAALAGDATQADPKVALQQIFTLLKAKDDTSRFVGLSLLRTLLDGNEHLRNDETVIKNCWEAVPNKFLTRLMRKGSGEEAQNMNSLAIAVVHIFISLLPSDQTYGKKMLELCEAIVKVTPALQTAPQMLAFQTLQSIVGSPAGAHSFARTSEHEDLATIVIAGEEQRYIREYLKLYSIAWMMAHQPDAKRFLLETVTQAMANSRNPATLVEVVAGISSELSYLGESKQTKVIIGLIQKSVSKRPTPQVRNGAIKLASEVLRHAKPGDTTISELFKGSLSTFATEEKPFGYVFLQYVLIDLRSTIPTLITNLASPTYQNDSLRLAACYDIIAAYIMCLVDLIERLDNYDEADSTNSPSLSEMPFSLDLQLKIRHDVNEAFSLTLEFFRDRWDAVTAGAAGLDPSARTDPKAPAMLTWENPAIAPEADPIVLSGLRALSLWIREGDNTELEKQTLGIADMLAALYMASMKESAKADFRHPILILLDRLLASSDEAVQMLLDQKAWDLFATDLKQATQSLRNPAPHTRDLIRVLLAIVTSDTVPQSREAWMDIIKWVSEIKDGDVHDAAALEVLAELYQLADAIWVKAAKKLQKASVKEAQQIAKKAASVGRRIEGTGVDEGLIDSFSEVSVSLGV